MPITQVPEVGKILVRKAPSTAPYPWYEDGGKIIRLAGKRVYYTASDGTEKFTHEYACVCDTQAEVDQLLMFAEDEKRALHEYMMEVAQRNAVLTTKLSWVKSQTGKKPSPAPAPKDEAVPLKGRPGAVAAKKVGEDPYLAGIMARGTAERLVAEDKAETPPHTARRTRPVAKAEGKALLQNVRAGGTALAKGLADRLAQTHSEGVKAVQQAQAGTTRARRTR